MSKEAQTNAEKIWAKASLILNESTSEMLKLWIKPLKPAKENDAYYKDGVFVLKSNQSFGVSELKTKHLQTIQEAISKCSGEKTAVDIVYVPDDTKKTKKKDTKEINVQALTQAQLHDLRQLNSYSGLNTDYTFDTFVVGDNSRVAYNAAKLIAENPGKKYNPLFITGSIGIGKTHIMQAIGHEVQKRFNARVRYTKTEEFTNQLVAAIRSDNSELKMRSFRQEYRNNVDVLLLDDIQFAEGKPKTEDEIFNVFDALFHSGKQIVFASDRPISSFVKTPERLKSRYEQGLVVEIKMPEFETRKEIIKSHAIRQNYPITDEVAEFLAENFTKNVRELQGAYNRISAYSSIQGVELTIESAKEILGITGNIKELTIDLIIEKCAQYYDVTPDDIMGSQRVGGIMQARQAAIYFARKLLNMSYPQLAKIFKKNHTTIMYSCDKLKKDIQANITLKRKISEIEKSIRG